jgi:hypothetical protein
MGEGEGGGGQDENPLVPPPLHPLPPRGGEIFGRICLINYGLLSKFEDHLMILDVTTAILPQRVHMLSFQIGA